MSVFHLNRRMLSDLSSVNEASLNHLCSQYWFMIIIKVTGPRNKPSQVLSTLWGINLVKRFLMGQGYIRSSILLFSLDDTWSCLIYLITQNISPAVRNFGGMVEWTLQSIHLFNQRVNTFKPKRVNSREHHCFHLVWTWEHDLGLQSGYWSIFSVRCLHWIRLIMFVCKHERNNIIQFIHWLLICLFSIDQNFNVCFNIFISPKTPEPMVAPSLSLQTPWTQTGSV